MTIKLLLALAALLSHLEPFAEVSLEQGERVAVERDLDAVATVQVELLPDHESAERLADEIRERLASAGLAHAVLVETVPGEPELPISYRVVVGPFFEFEDAERARTELERVGVHGFVREFEALVGC